jgi:hypothetical protein
MWSKADPKCISRSLADIAQWVYGRMAGAGDDNSGYRLPRFEQLESRYALSATAALSTDPQFILPIFAVPPIEVVDPVSIVNPISAGGGSQDPIEVAPDPSPSSNSPPTSSSGSSSPASNSSWTAPPSTITLNLAGNPQQDPSQFLHLSIGDVYAMLTDQTLYPAFTIGSGTLTIVSGPQNGSLVPSDEVPSGDSNFANAGEGYTYTPNPGFVGTDQITLHIHALNPGMPSGTFDTDVTINYTVEAPGSQFTVNNYTFSTPSTIGAPVAIWNYITPFLPYDEPGAYQVVQAPSLGSLSVNAYGQLVYTGTSAGNDTFEIYIPGAPGGPANYTFTANNMAPGTVPDDSQQNPTQNLDVTGAPENENTASVPLDLDTPSGPPVVAASTPVIEVSAPVAPTSTPAVMVSPSTATAGVPSVNLLAGSIDSNSQSTPATSTPSGVAVGATPLSSSTAGSTPYYSVAYSSALPTPVLNQELSAGTPPTSDAFEDDADQGESLGPALTSGL